MSRKHARIVERSGRFFAEDMGSSNGTRVNGELVAGPKELRNGDSITIGPVVVAFLAVEAKLSAPQLPLNIEDDGATRIVVSSTSIPKQAPAAAAVVPEPADDGATRIKTLAEVAPALAKGHSGVRKATGVGMQAVPPRKTTGVGMAAVQNRIDSSGARKVVGGSSAAVPKQDSGGRKSSISLPKQPPQPVGEDEVTGPPKGASAQATVVPGVHKDDDTTGPRDLPGIVRPPPRSMSSDEVSSSGVSAVERLRKRRRYGDTLGGQLAFLWDELPRGKKAIFIVLFTLLFCGTVAGLVYVFRPPIDPNAVMGPEPTTLSRTATPYRFGYGDDVDFERRDMKIFTFEFASATRAVAVLRYSAKNISAGEVTITLNGVEQGAVPPDTMDKDREVQQLLQVKDLKKGAVNQVIFDNVKNPPGRETWQVSNVSIEIIPIPEGTDEQLNALANDYVTNARKYYETREVGAENLFKAWKGYRSAWLTMEAMKDRPEAYDYTRQQLSVISRDLDEICSRMMLEVQRSLQLKNEKKASQSLDDIITYFPSSEHRCHNQALAMKAKLDL